MTTTTRSLRALPGNRWGAPLVTALLALSAMPLLGVDRAPHVMAACWIVAAGTWVVGFTADGRHRPQWTDLWSPWSFGLCSAAVMTWAFIAGRTSQRLPQMILIAAVLMASAAASLAWDRLRVAALDLVFEVIIGSGAVVLVAYSLVRPHFADAASPSAVTWAFASLAVVFAAGLAFGFVMAVDVDSLRPALFLLAGGLVAVAAAGGIVIWANYSTAAPESVLLVPAVMLVSLAAASFSHPSQSGIRSPAMAVEIGRIEHRALVAIAAVVVGPALLALDLRIDIELPTGFITGASVILALAVGLHVFRLLRKWGALEHDVHHDALTGLPNRPYFNARLENAIEIARGERRTMAVMFVDLDRFKVVNDSLGHAAGNVLLVEVARRLTGSVSRDAIVARIGGDEFAVLIRGVNNYRHSEQIARTVLKAFEAPFDVGRRKLYMTPSLGVAHYPADGGNPHDLIEHADEAMYRAKERGRNTVELYTHERRVSAVNRLDLESALHNAVDQNQLRLYYQPKVNIKTGRVCSVEALLRWDHPILGPVPPDEFIPLAEESGLISIIGEWTLIEACTTARAWMDKGIRDVTMAVNLSPRQFQLQRVQDMVARVLRLTRLPAEMLELELTENLALRDPEGVAVVIGDLHDMGVRCSIDDFGVGYSGLSYLDQFQFDAIKIDRTFVSRIGANGAPIVTAVIALAKGLQIDVVAEGVETVEQLEFLRRHGCDMMQGFLFSKARSAEELEPILRKVLESPRAELVRNFVPPATADAT